MTRAVTIRIEGRPPTPNARRHWRVTALDNDTWKGAARVAALASLPPDWTPLEWCEAEVTFLFPTRGRRDWDNAIASTKPCWDGIVAAGVIVDDSMRVIDRLTWHWKYAKGEQATVYRITELVP